MSATTENRLSSLKSLFQNSGFHLHFIPIDNVKTAVINPHAFCLSLFFVTTIITFTVFDN